MRIPPNLKFFILFLLGVGLIVLATIYLPRVVPGIGKILGNVMVYGMLALCVFVFVKPFFTFLYERTDGVLTVFKDENGKGFHVFGYHINSGGDSAFGTRDIQHYYILYTTGKLYFSRIFSHSMEPDTARSGWGGFSSFEQNVLPSPKFIKSMNKLSARSGTKLQLGSEIKGGDNDHYTFQAHGKIIELKKYENVVDEGFAIVCSEKSSGTITWKKKI